MTEVSRTQPIVLDTDSGAVLGQMHAPASSGWSGTSVLIVGPWGWDDVVTYRSRRDWADDLAAAGHVALRIDLPGSGDSAGAHADDGLVPAWSGAVAAATAYLRGLRGSRRVAVIGMGLGGLVTLKAIDAGASVDDAILWATPRSGRAFLREMRAFSNLQAVRFSLTGEPEPELLPPGWLEVGGFVLSSRTMAELEPLDATGLAGHGLRRVLLLDRDGLPLDERVRLHLVESGADVVLDSGVGWAAMCADIEQHQPPLAVFATVRRFLDHGLADAEASAGGPAVLPEGEALAAATLRAGPDAIRQTAVSLDAPAGRNFGILTEPENTTRTGLCAVFLNAGAVRRIGPNRMWVDASRRWAARGVPSLRLDIEGIGDADGDAFAFADVNAFYRPGLERQVTAALDLLEARGLGNRFILIGLCSGAYWAFQVGVADDRVTAIAMLNPRALIWDPHVFVRLASRDARKVLERSSWGRLLRGRIGPRRVASVGRALAIRYTDALLDAAAAGRLRSRGAPRPDSVESLLSGLDRRGTNVLLAFSDEEPLCGWLEDRGVPARFARWPNASFVRLPGRDHTVRPIVAQTAVQALLDRVLDGQLRAAGETHTDPSRSSAALVQPPAAVP